MQISYFQTSSSSETFNTESTWSKDLAYGFFNFWDHVRAMFGPCRDHVWPSLTSRPARALKFSRLSKHGLRPMSAECPLIRTISGPYLDHVGTIFGLALLTDQLEHYPC